MKTTSALANILVVLACLLCVACTTPIGAFTLLSTKPFDPPAGNRQRVAGKDCLIMIFIVPVTSTTQPTVAGATRDALARAKADLLVDVTMSRSILLLPPVYARVCEVVEGTAVSLSR